MEKKIIKKPRVLKTTDEFLAEMEKTPTPPKQYFPKNKEKSPISFIVMFTVLGRKHWRCSQYPTKENFDTYLAHPSQKSHPKVLERKWFAVDTLQGTITPLN